MIKAEPQSRPETITGEAFLACGCVILRTDGGIYTLEDDDFAGRIVGLLRDLGITEVTSGRAVVDVEVRAVEVVEAAYIPAGFNHLAHSERTVTYEVPLISVSKSFKGRTLSFLAGVDVCRELAATEQLREEF